MSAARHVHPKQLSMFMPAGKLADPKQVIHGDRLAYADHNDMVRTKLQESATGGVENARYGSRMNNPTLRESIQKHGVQEPVDVLHEGTDLRVFNGHHRVFTAADLDPSTEVPVRWMR